jgi:hypothetical protein
MTVAERNEILAEGERLRAAILDWDTKASFGGTIDEQALQGAYRRSSELHDRYRQWLPEVPVSRCPDTGVIVRWPIDTVDLDGWFWEYDAPVRRPPQWPRTWLAMAGALRIGGSVAPAPFLAKPGPEVPYVVPRLLEQPAVRAVIAELPIGPHTGLPITYFGPRPRGVSRVNLWGTNTYPVIDGGEWLGWDEVPEWSPDNDYDLRPWLDSGKLLWIAPGDQTMTLRQGVHGCPYVGHTGNHEYALVEDGDVRYPAPPPQAARSIRMR